MRVFCLVVLIAGLLGCGSSNPAANAPAENFGPSDMLYATSWQGIDMLASYAETKVDTAGHFSTSYTTCYQDGTGALEGETWKTIVTNLNSITAKPLLDEAKMQCFAAPQENHMDGYVKILKDGQKLTILDNRWNGEICTTAQDVQMAQNLLTAMQTVITMASHADCPGY